MFYINTYIERKVGIMGLPDNCKLDLHSKWKHGSRNLITDVPGVKVGNVTVNDGDIHTGVTAVLPHEGNIFQDKVMAGVSVINGFGKSIGCRWMSSAP